jgi:hypothetical protein
VSRKGDVFSLGRSFTLVRMVSAFWSSEGVAAVVPVVDEGADGGDEVFDAGEAATAVGPGG